MPRSTPDPAERRRGVFVLGMHRSGTSAVTRAVNLLGVPTGSSDALKRPSPRNLAGFWEIGALTAFNEELLVELGGSWDAPPTLPRAWADSSELEPFRERGRELFEGLHATPQWVWKDPRNCLLLGFWIAALEVEPVVVLVHRNPLEIAASLARRDQLSTRSCFALWERYLRQALSQAEGLPVLMTRYEDLLDDPRGWAAAAKEFLTAHGVESSVEPVAQIERFIDRELRHAEFTASDIAAEARLAEPQRELLAALENIEPAQTRFDPPPLPDETRWTEPLLEERRLTAASRRAETVRLKEARKARRKALRRMQKTLERIERNPVDPASPGVRQDLGRLRALLDEALAAEDESGV